MMNCMNVFISICLYRGWLGIPHVRRSLLCLKPLKFNPSTGLRVIQFHFSLSLFMTFGLLSLGLIATTIILLFNVHVVYPSTYVVVCHCTRKSLHARMNSCADLPRTNRNARWLCQHGLTVCRSNPPFFHITVAGCGWLLRLLLVRVVLFCCGHACCSVAYTAVSCFVEGL